MFAIFLVYSPVKFLEAQNVVIDTAFDFSKAFFITSIKGHEKFHGTKDSKTF